MSPSVMELKAKIYDEVVKNNVSQRAIASLEQELLALLKAESEAAQVPVVCAEVPEVSQDSLHT